MPTIRKDYDQCNSYRDRLLHNIVRRTMDVFVKSFRFRHIDSKSQNKIPACSNEDKTNRVWVTVRSNQIIIS